MVDPAGSYLTQHTQRLAAIDASIAAIKKDFARSRASQAKTWAMHFRYLWGHLCRQAGWPDGLTPRRRSMLHHWLGWDRTLDVVGRSALWSLGADATAAFPQHPIAFPTDYGFDFEADGCDTWSILATGHYVHELAETYVVLSLLPLMDTVLDVGANLGFYTLLACAQSDARVIAFEPDSRIRRRLTALVNKHPGHARVEIVGAAVGKSSETRTLYLGTGGNGAQSLRPSSHEPNGPTESVQVTTLDDVWETRRLAGQKCLIKVDVENHEHAVFEGMPRWLSADIPPCFIFESWPSAPTPPQRIYDLLKHAGYRVFSILPAAPQSHDVLGPEGRVAPQGTGNHLALAPWAWPYLERLRQPLDARLFTATAQLDTMRRFLSDYSQNLKAAIP